MGNYILKIGQVPNECYDQVTMSYNQSYGDKRSGWSESHVRFHGHFETPQQSVGLLLRADHRRVRDRTLASLFSAEADNTTNISSSRPKLMASRSI